MIKKLIIALVSLLLGGILLFIGISLYIDHEFPHPAPQCYLSGQSPDGTWAVEVWRVANDAYPRRDGVDVIVVVKDAQGNELQRKQIDNRDRWEDVEEEYPEVIITNTEINVGPHRRIIKKVDVDFKKSSDDNTEK